MGLFQEELKVLSDNQKHCEIWQKNLHKNIFGKQSASECPFLGSTWIFNKNLNVFASKALLERKKKKKKVYEHKQFRTRLKV